MAAAPTRPAGRYPHPTSILSYSRIWHRFNTDGTVDGAMPVLPDHLDAGGRMRLGALAPLLDSCAGVLAARAVAPDWCATLDFKVHLLQPPGAGGRVAGLARTLRVGSNTVLSENVVRDDAGGEVAVAYVTFSRLPARQDNHSRVRTGRSEIDYTHPDEEPRLPFDEYYGVRLLAEQPAFELDHHERIYNSFGSVQGGAMAALLERAGALAAERHTGGPARTVDLHFSYLAQATTGPFRVEARPMRAADGEVLSVVEFVDTGNGDRLCAVGTAVAVAIDPA